MLGSYRDGGVARARRISKKLAMAVSAVPQIESLEKRALLDAGATAVPKGLWDAGEYWWNAEGKLRVYRATNELIVGLAPHADASKVAKKLLSIHQMARFEQYPSEPDGSLRFAARVLSV